MQIGSSQQFPKKLEKISIIRKSRKKWKVYEPAEKNN